MVATKETLAKASRPAPSSSLALREVYSDIMSKLAKLLAENETMRLWMSQAIIPGLVRRMDDRRHPPKDPSSPDELWDLLMRESSDISPDYPYPSTRVVEAALGYDTDSDLKTMILDVEGTNDPLLVSAVTIAMSPRVYGKAFVLKRKDRAWSKLFSEAVNYIQDALLRDIIARRLVSVVGVTVGGSVDDPTKHFVGGGENPYPEMAAMLNPTLVMTPEQQQGRRLRMKLLETLISPPGEMVGGEAVVYLHSVNDVFGNQGIQASAGEQALETEAALQGAGQEASGVQSILRHSEANPPATLGECEAQQQELSRKFSALNAELDEARRDAEKTSEIIEVEKKKWGGEKATLKRQITRLDAELSKARRGASETIEAEKDKWERERAELKSRITRLDADLEEARRGKPIVAARDYGKESLGILATAMGWDADLIGFAKRWVELYHLSGAEDSIIKEALRKAGGKTKPKHVLPMVLIENTKGRGTLSLLRVAPKYEPEEALDMEYEVIMDMVIKHWKPKKKYLKSLKIAFPNLNDYPIVIPELTKEGDDLNAQILERLEKMRQQPDTSQSALRDNMPDRRIGRASRRWKIEVNI